MSFSPPLGKLLRAHMRGCSHRLGIPEDWERTTVKKVARDPGISGSMGTDAPASTRLGKVVLRHYSSRMTLPDRKTSLVWPHLLCVQRSQESGPDQPALVVDIGTELDYLNIGNILEKMSTLA